MMTTWLDLLLLVIGPNAPLLLAMPAFMPGFRKPQSAGGGGGTTGQPMGLLLALTYAS